MSNSVLGLSIDCADAAKLAQFWADVLGREVNPQPTAEFAAIDANDSTQGPRLTFHQVPDAKTLKNRLHRPGDAQGIGSKLPACSNTHFA